MTFNSCQKQMLHHLLPLSSPMGPRLPKTQPWVPGHSPTNVETGGLHEALPPLPLPFSTFSSGHEHCLNHFQGDFPHKRWVEGEEGTAPSLFLDKDRERQDRRVSHAEDRTQNLICNAGPGIPDVTKAPSLPPRKIGLVTILSPNGHTLCSLELHLLG